MKRSCKKFVECEMPVCHDLGCVAFEQRTQNTTRFMHEAIKERIAVDPDVRELYKYEPLLHRFLVAMERLGDDEHFIAGFVISLLQERIFIYKELMGNNNRH